MPDDAGTLLAAVQLAGHKAIDTIYRTIAAAIHAAILRRATPDARGILRLSLPSRAAILSDLGHLLDDARGQLFVAVMTSVKEAEAAAGLAAAGLPSDIQSLLSTTYGTVWPSLGTDRASVISQTGALLIRGIAGGAPASEVAATVRQYFSPFFAPRRDEAGKLLRADREGAIKSWPGRSGMASAHARTIMLTETTAAHGRSQLRIALYGDQLMKYHVSRQHTDPDRCSDLARADTGFGAGVYEPRDAPLVPQHVRCRCFYSRVDRPAREDAA